MLTRFSYPFSHQQFHPIDLIILQVFVTPELLDTQHHPAFSPWPLFCRNPTEAVKSY